MAKKSIKKSNLECFDATIDKAVFLSGTNKTLYQKLKEIDSGSIDEYKGKRITILGDSFSDPNNAHPKYYSYVLDKLGVTIAQNYAVGGYRVCPKRYDADDAGVDDGNSAFSKLSTYVLTDSDIVIIALGINDFFSSVPIGEVKGTYASSYNTDTFCGAYETIVKKIIQDNITANKLIPRIILCTPTLSATMAGGVNKHSNTVDYRNAIVNIAEMWGAEVCDWTMGSGFNALASGKSVGYTSDTCHPNDRGAERLGRMLCKTITSI